DTVHSGNPAFRRPSFAFDCVAAPAAALLPLRWQHPRDTLVRRKVKGGLLAMSPKTGRRRVHHADRLRPEGDMYVRGRCSDEHGTQRSVARADVYIDTARLRPSLEILGGVPATTRTPKIASRLVRLE